MFQKIIQTTSVFLILLVMAVFLPTWASTIAIVLSVLFLPRTFVGIFGAALFHDILYLANGVYSVETILRSAIAWFIASFLLSWLLHKHTRFSKIRIQ